MTPLKGDVLLEDLESVKGNVSFLDYLEIGDMLKSPFELEAIVNDIGRTFFIVSSTGTAVEVSVY